jgi:hypothetical protein
MKIPKKALELAGKMATAAINLTGGEGLNFKQDPCNIIHLGHYINQLREATEQYNKHIIEWTNKEKKNEN